MCVTSGMAALFIALQALDIQEGDEVILPAFPLPTPLALCYVKAKPIFVDIEPSSLCIDPDNVREAITEKTKAIIVIHTHNTMANMDEFLRIRKEYNIPIIEDCAHAHGMRWNKKGAGFIGDCGIFSFQETKALTAGEGGLVTTDSEKIYKKVMAIKNMGKDGGGQYVPNIIGWNLRMTEFQAAVLCAQMKRFPEQVEKKLGNIRYLEDKLNTIDGISYIHHHKAVSRATGFLYSLIYEEEKMGNTSLSLCIEAMQAEGLPIRTRQISYHSPDIAQYCESLQLKPMCPVAEDTVKDVLFTIPHTVFLGETSDMDDIVQIVKKVKDNIGELKRNKLFYYMKKIKDKFF